MLEKLGASLVAQMVKNMPAVQEIQVGFLCQEDAPGEGNGYTLVFLPGEIHGQRRLVAYNP